MMFWWDIITWNVSGVVERGGMGGLRLLEARLFRC